MIRFAIHSRGRQSRLGITGSQNPVNHRWRHLILAVISHHGFDSKPIRQLYRIRQTNIETFIIIISPFQGTIIIHITYRKTIQRLFVSTGYAQIVLRRTCIAKQYILPVSIHKDIIVHITESGYRIRIFR